MSETLLISVIAGKTIANLRERAERARAVVRAMPNTPAARRPGHHRLRPPRPETTPEQVTLATALLQSIGRVEWVGDEAMIDAVTALSGSGPAYVFHSGGGHAAAGEKAGLHAELAMRSRAPGRGRRRAALPRARGRSASELRPERHIAGRHQRPPRSSI